MPNATIDPPHQKFFSNAANFDRQLVECRMSDPMRSKMKLEQGTGIARLSGLAKLKRVDGFDFGDFAIIQGTQNLWFS